MNNLRIIVPTVLAIVAVAAGIRAAGLEAFTGPQVTVESAPTPYSTSHAVVQSRPGPAEDHPDTF